MKFCDLKYLLAYLIPITGFMAVAFSGCWKWSAVIFAFIVIPIIELFVSKSKNNWTKEEEEHRKNNHFFDALLYLNLPIIYSLIGFYLIVMHRGGLAIYETIGMTLSVGIVLGAGINVAHELGHKQNALAKWVAKLILLPSLYMHFIIEHNRGHHVHIATPEDPATSRKGETLYGFWLRSSVFSYLSAWKLEFKRLRRADKYIYSFENEMIRFQLIQLLYLLLVYLLFGLEILGFAVSIAIVGFLLLETINYIEHYGLVRTKLANGRYEKVNMRHSWNSNHELGRIVLYELTRHSDHHFKANRKYQVLRHHDESPQLPFGYPGSMLLSSIPPLWFYIMNKKLSEI